MALTIIILIIFFFSVIVHEYCHGYVAYLNGDYTAKSMGRLTLNPIPHIDIFGTILLPLLLILFGFRIVVGWAKPVPINPWNFRDYDKGLLQVGIAGPLSNIVLGTIFALLYRFIGGGFVGKILIYSSYLNFLLAIFNLIPIPPLDGSRIISVFLPPRIRMGYERIERYGIFIVLAILMCGFLNWIFYISQIIANKIAGI